jgi:hypothetical protein
MQYESYGTVDSVVMTEAGCSLDRKPEDNALIHGAWYAECEKTAT